MITRIPPEPLKTERLLIRPFEIADVSDVYTALRSVGGYDGGGNPFATPESTRESISVWASGYKDASCYTYAIVVDEHIVGLVELHGFVDANGLCSLGYLLTESARGKGFASEAVRAVVGFAFDKLGVDMISLNIIPNNQDSINVATAIGARKLDQIDGRDFYILIPSMFKRKRR